MPIGDILLKLGRGETLSAGELDDLRLWGNESELGNAFLAGLQDGTSDIYANEIRASRGIFRISPVAAGAFSRITDATITTSTYTDVDFTAGSHTQLFGLRLASDGSKVYLDKSLANRFRISGFISFAYNATGNRQLIINFYDTADAYINGYSLVADTGGVGISGSTDTYYFSTDIPRITPISQSFGPDTSYFKMNVWQDSGGDLAVNYMFVSLIQVE